MLFMKNKLLIFLCIILVSNSYSYPISPVTLRKLIEYSKYIIIAKVSYPERKIQNDTSYNVTDNNDAYIVTGRAIPKQFNETADLTILNTLKGKFKSQMIKVENDIYAVCPKPARYPDSAIVIAFLGKDDTSSVFYTIGLSYGSKLMNNEEKLTAFKARIEEYIKIEKIKNRNKRESSLTEWLVKCVENKYTRWDGALELSNITDTFYSKKKEFDLRFTDNQTDRIIKAFFLTDTIKYGELFLVNFISKDNIPKDNIPSLKKYLLKNLMRPDCQYVTDIMKKMTEFYADNELNEAYEKYLNSIYKKDYINRKLYFDKFIEIAKD